MFLSFARAWTFKTILTLTVVLNLEVVHPADTSASKVDRADGDSSDLFWESILSLSFVITELCAKRHEAAKSRSAWLSPSLSQVQVES